MKISIVTSCWNRANSIANSIESVLSQDYADKEYIIVDGASTDNTMEVVNRYIDRIDSVTSEPDKGMYEGINKGLRKATGDIVGLLHSDDTFYATDTLSRIAKEFERTDADLIYGNGIFVRANDTNYVVRDWISGGYERDRIVKGWLPLHTTVFIKRSVLETVGYYNESYKISADTDWLIRCLYKHSLKVAYLDDYIVRMKMGGASTSFKLMKRKWSEDLKVYKSNGLPQYISLSLKILSKVPQFVKAKMKRIKSKVTNKVSETSENNREMLPTNSPEANTAADRKKS